MGKDWLWSRPMSPQARLILSRVTLFQAQVIRDALLERATVRNPGQLRETDGDIALRVGVQESVVTDIATIRYKALIPEEIAVADYRAFLSQYLSGRARMGKARLKLEADLSRKRYKVLSTRR